MFSDILASSTEVGHGLNAILILGIAIFLEKQRQSDALHVSW